MPVYYNSIEGWRFRVQEYSKRDETEEEAEGREL